jgi:hypothetical protein
MGVNSVAFAGARSNIGERFALEGSLHKMPQEMVVVLSERLVVMVERGFTWTFGRTPDRSKLTIASGNTFQLPSGSEEVRGFVTSNLRMAKLILGSATDGKHMLLSRR